jgi:Ca2+-binding RTX toxin-like protein
MSKISIEGKKITGLVPFGHLYLVYEDDAGREYVLRGGPELDGDPSYGHLVVTGWNQNVLLEDSFDKRLDASDNPVTPEQRGQIVLFSGLDVDATWNLMKLYAEQIRNAELPYDASGWIGWNSNSLVGALLNLVGLNVDNFIPNSEEVYFPYPGQNHLFPIDTTFHLPKGSVRLELGTGSADHAADTVYGASEYSIYNSATLKLGGGNDRFEYTNGQISYDGGDDTDIVSFRSVQTGLNVALAGLDGTVSTSNNPNVVVLTFKNVEHVYGSGGDDTFTVGTVADGILLDGAGGVNTLDLSQLNIGTTFQDADGRVLKTIVNLESEWLVTADTSTKITSFSHVLGTTGNDVILGNQFDNAILGNAGNDLIFGGGGVDAIDGGTGNDEIYGGADDDILFGGAGDDTIIGGAGADEIDGGTNTAIGDTVSYVSSTAVKINLSSFGPQSGGDAEGDTLKGIENFIGSAEGDEIEGSDISNWLRGFGGDDTFFIRTAKGGNLDILNGGDGSDRLDLSLATFAERIFDPNGVDQFRFIADLNTGSVRAASMSASLISIENINGSDLADKLIGNAGVNIINGGGGSDWIFGGAGADIIDGGAGRNKINYTDSNAAVDVDLNRVEQIGGHAQGDQLFNILEVDGSNFADSIRLRSEGWGFVWAAGGNDRIYGGTGENIVYGDVGNDTFYYGGGKSTFYGGIGTNTLDLSLVDKGYLFDLGYVPKVVLANISQQNADETINFFETSRVVGSEGNDTFKMYNKGFFVDGGGGYDTVDLTNLNFNVGIGMTFDLIAGTIKNKNGAFATFANIENSIGSQGDDNFISYGPNGHFFGGNGLDVLWASEYAEWFDGGSVTDRIDYRNSNAAVNVDLGRAVQHGGYAEGDQLFDVEVVVGSNFNDTIDLKSLGHTAVGLDGDDDIFVFNNDTAFGDAGEDHIYINGRYNTIYGGADQDTFHVKGAFDSTQIKDYEYGEQIIFEGYAPGSVTVRVSAEDVYLSFYQQTLYLRGAGYNHAQFSPDDILFA